MLRRFLAVMLALAVLISGAAPAMAGAFGAQSKPGVGKLADGKKKQKGKKHKKGKKKGGKKGKKGAKKPGKKGVKKPGE